MAWRRPPGVPATFAHAVLILVVAAIVGVPRPAVVAGATPARSSVGSILSDGSTRIQSRVGRLDEGRPSVPYTIVFGLTLIVIHDRDRPYDGLAQVRPDAMITVENRIAELAGGNGRPPCDADGRPLRVAP